MVRGSVEIRNQDRERNIGDCHGTVVLAITCWSTGQIKELYGIRRKDGV